MIRHKIFQVSISVYFFFAFLSPLRAQLSKEFCESLKDFGQFYENQDSSTLQSAKLFLSYQHQVGHIDGTDKKAQDFDDSFEEFRRVWVGISGKFGSYWKFKVVSQVSNDRNAYLGDYRQWGHETFRAANITFDADKFWEFEGVDAMTFGYGRRTGRMADEWQRSSTMINCLERSSFSNQLWLYDQEKGNPLATWVKWTAGKHTFDTAIFSGTYDDYIGGWEDSKVYYGSWLGDFSAGSSYELLEYWISYYKQEGIASEDRLAGGNDWSLALVNRFGNGPWSLHSTFAWGNNGDQTTDIREGDFGGIVFMPMYWLKAEKIKLVGRYLYQQADEAEGLKLNSRYIPLSGRRDSVLDVNNGRGDEHQALYLGINYYLCGENLKIVSGVQHDELKSMGSNQFRGWTVGSSLRVWF
jgi:phosphate-selective porin OprO/OprP